MAVDSKNNKDIIYIDTDDEITAVIDKVRSSGGRVVALVLPKRATVFQSIVNMKLLKRNAEQAKKHLVLITSESGLLSLAGTVGLYVAKTPQSKPEIPVVADLSSETGKDDEEVELDDSSTEDEGFTADNAGDRPVGELAAAGIVGTSNAIETLEMPNDEEGSDDVAVEASDKKKTKTKTPKVPNFNRFRLLLILGIVFLILVIVGLYFALKVLPRAAIAITTNASDVNVNLSMTLDTTATKLDTAQMIVPAKTEQQQKTTSLQVPATGQKNNGVAATGKVTLINCSKDGSERDIPAGTGVSVNGLTFITQESAQLFSSTPTCKAFEGFTSATIPVKAQQPGVQYNIAATSFTVAGQADVNASSSNPMTGGTDNIVKVVSQSDIDNASKKLATQDTSAIKSSLQQTLIQDGMYPLAATFSTGNPVITSSSNVGDTADNVTVTQVVTYTMFGAKKSDLQTLIDANIAGQVDTGNQAILDDGLQGASVSITNATPTVVQLSLKTTATVGPEINVAEVKKAAAGKKSGEVKSAIKSQSGVTDVEINLSPFWVSSIPSNTNKITVTISKTGTISGRGNNP